MKNKFTRILGVGLTLALISGLMLMAIPASAATLLWYQETVIPKTDDLTLAPAGLDIVDLAVNGDTMYVATGGGGTLGAVTNGGSATWSTTEKEFDSYSAKLSKAAASVAGSVYVEFTPQPGITIAHLDDITANPEWSFWYKMAEGTLAGPQLELRFTNPADAGHVDVTLMPLQAGTPKDGTWTELPVLSTSGRAIFYGNDSAGTPFEWGTGVYNLDAILVAIEAANTADTNEGDWQLTRVRLELWEAGERDCYIDDVTIDGVNYLIERGDLYKSTNGGQTWTSLYNTTYYPKKAVKLVAVAPDDPDILAFVADDNKVYYSTGGGASWSGLGKPADAATGKTAVINAIDVSPGLGDYRLIAVAGDDGTVATLDTFFLGVGGAWYDQTVSAYKGFEPAQTTVEAVKFSPNYWTDKIITCVSSDSNAAYFQVFWDESNRWNDEIAAFPNYPVEVDSLLCEPLTSASIALPSTYLGGDETTRIAFVGLAAPGTLGPDETNGGVYRLSDYSIGGSGVFATWSAGAEGAIKSLAYHESGKLLAGAEEGNVVYSCLSPMAAYPRFNRVNTLKQPGGERLTIVAWSGDTAVAGTSGDESAFAVSTDDGYSFNDISLIDTVLSNVSDIAVSADGSKLYMASYDGTDASIWVKESSWARTLSLSGKQAAILRLAPEDDSTVYVAFPGFTSVYMSKDSGKGLWKDISCYRLTATGALKDMVVESADVVYAIDAAGCSKTTNAGASWGSKKPLGIAGHMVTLAPNGDVLVGGSDGYVSVSSDGGATFVKTAQVGTGDVQVIADKDYADNGIMYAAVGTGATAYVKRSYTATPIGWSNYGPDDLPDSSWSYKGLAENEGTIYALSSSSNTTASRLYRSFYMRTAVSTPLAYWSYLDSADCDTWYSMRAEPQALKLSAGPTLWAVGNGYRICSASDPIATVGPTLKAPADGAAIQVNPATGRAYNVAFNWERYSSKYINSCDLIIATDSAFKGVVYYNTFTGITSDSIAKVVGPTGSEVTIKDVVYSNRCDFMPGATYYWMARVSKDGPMYSPWSAARSFTIESTVDFAVISPEQGATNVGLQPAFVWGAVEGAVTYELVVAEDSTFAIIDWSHSTANTFYQAEEVLSYDTTYYWRVRPAGGDWASGVFTTMAEPVEAVPTVVVEKEPAPPAPPPEIVTIEVPGAPAPPAAIPDSLLWAIIGIGAVLVIALIVLIVRTRRVA